jgi:acetyltransferase-like isoleucine patch superfamily enzyme
MFGHSISPTARIGPTIVRQVARFEIGDHVRISLFNVFKGVNLVHLDRFAAIESWNWISAHPAFQEVNPQAGTFFLGYSAKLGSRNYVDCSGTVVLRDYGAVGGHRCFIQTHEPDFHGYRQMVGRVTVGHHSLVGSCAVMLKDAYLPDQSLLGANSTMTSRSALERKRGLYAGSPAVWKCETIGLYFDRTARQMTEFIVDGPMGALEEDLPASGHWFLSGNDPTEDD